MQRTPMSMAVPNELKSSTMRWASPCSTRLTVGGRFLRAGRALASASTAPRSRPASSTSMLTFCIRSTRSICAGPLPRRMSATAARGTEPTLAGTRNWAMASRSVRRARSRRTRIGIWRWGRLSLGRLTLKSPKVATRTAPARAAVVTPRSAARAKSGRIWISGRWRLAPEVTLPTPRRVRRSRSIALAAVARAMGSSLAKEIWSFSPD